MVINPPFLSNVSSGELVYRLCDSILEYWSLVLQQETWALKQTPGPSGPSRGSTPLSSVGNPEQSHMDLDYPKTRNINKPVLESKNWNMVRFLLNQERDQLYLWRQDFTRDDFDKLMSKEPNILGNVVLKSLVSIGKALLDGTVPPKNITPTDTQNCPVEELRALVQMSIKRVSNVFYTNDAASATSDSSFVGTGAIVFGTTGGERETQLHQALKSDIGRLQSLSVSIWQALSETSE